MQGSRDDRALAEAMINVKLKCLDQTYGCPEAKAFCGRARDAVSDNQERHDESLLRSDIDSGWMGQTYAVSDRMDYDFVGVDSFSCDADAAAYARMVPDRYAIAKRHDTVIDEWKRWYAWASSLSAGGCREAPAPAPESNQPSEAVLRKAVADAKEAAGDDYGDDSAYQEAVAAYNRWHGPQPMIYVTGRASFEFLGGVGFGLAKFGSSEPTYFGSNAGVRRYIWFKRPYDYGLDLGGRFNLAFHDQRDAANKNHTNTVFEVVPEVRLWWHWIAIGAFAEWRPSDYVAAAGKHEVLAGIEGSFSPWGPARRAGGIPITLRYTPMLATAMEALDITARWYFFMFHYERHVIEVKDGTGGARLGTVTSFFFGGGGAL